jgi:DNA polymerase/3'-5' exonuclease PolX
MNQDIIDNLHILERYYKKIGDHWRKQSYENAAAAIKRLDFKITDISQVKKVRGIGKSISEKIKEYLDTGQIRKVEEVKNQLQKKQHKNSKETSLELFETVWGIGEETAKRLYAEGLRTIDDLKHNQHLLSKNQRIGLKYYKDLLKPIPREYIDLFKIVLKVVISKEFGLNSFKMQIAGSYRRGSRQSGDIDCLITSKAFNLEELINALKKWGIVTDVLSMREEKFMGIVHCPNNHWHHFRMDIEFLPEDEWGSGLLYFTGSKAFNVAMRKDAKRLGLTLNQHGLFDSLGNRIPVYKEKEIMNAVGMQYISPDKR